MSQGAKLAGTAGLVFVGAVFGISGLGFLMALCFVLAFAFLMLAAWEFLHFNRFFALPEPEFDEEEVSLLPPPMSSPGVHKLELPKPTHQH